jgi:cyclopropane fatty-acyl-phospholipid synthase-like methyltransferase
MDWKKHFNHNPNLFKETEFLKQVEKTVSGQPITSVQCDALISDIHKALDLSKDDFILDLCCGNGIITSEISRHCNGIIGIDFSKPLIKIAEKHNKPDNVSYYCMSILDKNVNNIIHKRFTKIYMYEALQHFEEHDLQRILELVLEISSSNPLFFIGSIPDADKLWDFYNTEERRADYRRRKSQGEEAIGTWWSRDYIADVCLQNGLECEFLSQNQILHSAHYRFDVRLTKLGN